MSLEEFLIDIEPSSTESHPQVVLILYRAGVCGHDAEWLLVFMGWMHAADRRPLCVPLVLFLAFGNANTERE
jgi:hypothetical protein